MTNRFSFFAYNNQRKPQKLMIPEKYLEYLALERILQKELPNDITIPTRAAMTVRRNSLEKEIIENYTVFEKEKE